MSGFEVGAATGDVVGVSMGLAVGYAVGAGGTHAHASWAKL